MAAGEGEGRKTLVKALHDKYSFDEDTEIKIHVKVPKGAPGFSEEGKLIVPQHLSLNNCNITDAGEDTELKDLCSTVCELDLAGNAVQEWTEVFKIMSHCPHVTFLNLSKNQLCNSTSTVTEAVKDCELSLVKLEKLVLNCLQLEWSVVWQLLNVLPRVYELHLSLNEYSQVTIETSQTFPNITTLHINGNKISDWSEISKLGQLFPSLQTLVMTENPITTIDTSSVENFSCLTSLNISKTELSDWTEIEKLRSFPSLNDVRLTNIPFMEDLEEKPRRQRVIAYLPNVERLNGSKVGATEREDAERAFIRLYLDTEEKPPRCLELESVYGKLDPLVDVDLSKNSDLVQVHVVFKERSKLMNINITLTVGEMKRKHLAAFTGLHPAQFRVFHRDVGAPYGDEELKHPKKFLHALKLKTGDELHLWPR